MKNMKSFLGKTVRMLLTLSWVYAASAASVFAADPAYPSKPVRLVIPYAPGGSVEIVARLITPELSQLLGTQVVVDCRGGAGGVLGTEIVAKAEPDGYTLLLINVGHAMNPAFYKLPYDSMKSFTMIGKLLDGLHVLAVSQGVPAQSVKELIALAKQKPGQLIAVAAGKGSSSHLGAELFRGMAGIDFKIVQFKGAGPAVIDLIGGHSQFIITSILPVLPHIKSGKLRVLGTCGLKRSMILPDVPTIAESGLAGFDVSGWFGMVAPAGTPGPIVARLSKEIKTVLSSAELQKQFLSQGVEAAYLSPTEFGPFIEREIAKWDRVAKEANIKK
jgi:tripartite-type tricarboxylate transporter receptor subunit TctC